MFAPVATAAVLYSLRAKAYRPFDGTDADVAVIGSLELEIVPVHWYTQAGRNYAIAPDTVLNLGILPDTELVVDFQDFVALGALRLPSRGAARYQHLVKHVFREGVFQEVGVSVAAEAGPLTPETQMVPMRLVRIADPSFRIAGDFGTVHFNQWPQYSREHNLDLFSGVILEGPHDWIVRPVAEFFYES